MYKLLIQVHHNNMQSGVNSRSSHKDYEYEEVDSDDIEEYFMDENKFMQLPWEDLMWVFCYKSHQNNTIFLTQMVYL